MQLFGEPLGYYGWMSLYYLLNSLGSLSWALFSALVAYVIYRVWAPKTGEGRYRGTRRDRG